MATIRKNWPVIIPPWLSSVGSSGGIPIVSYAAFDWTNSPPIGGNNTLPLRGVLNTTAYPLTYPRGLALSNEITAPASVYAYCAARSIATEVFNVMTVQSIEGIPGEYSGWLNRLFEPNSYTAVSNGGAGTNQIATMVSDKWQGGDALFIINTRISFAAYYTGSAPIVPNTDLVDHDTAQANAIQAAFERIKLIYWHLPVGGPDEADIESLYDSIVGGVSNAEFHTAALQTEIDDSILASVTDFFGA